MAGAGFVDCLLGVGLRRLEAAAELEHFGRKSRMACKHFSASVKRSANPSITG